MAEVPDEALLEVAKFLVEVAARSLDEMDGVPPDERPSKRNMLKAIDMAQAAANRENN